MIPDEELYEELAPPSFQTLWNKLVITQAMRMVRDAAHARETPCPATPPSVSPAAETSSGEERSTAGGAGSCCVRMGTFRRREDWFEAINATHHLLSWNFCPWCGTPLTQET